MTLFVIDIIQLFFLVNSTKFTLLTPSRRRITPGTRPPPSPMTTQNGAWDADASQAPSSFFDHHRLLFTTSTSVSTKFPWEGYLEGTLLCYSFCLVYRDSKTLFFLQIDDITGNDEVVKSRTFKDEKYIFSPAPYPIRAAHQGSYIFYYVAPININPRHHPFLLANARWGWFFGLFLHSGQSPRHNMAMLSSIVDCKKRKNNVDH